ncbi:hypothetical protein ACIP9G_00295 [Lysinibacillus sp. NPDC093197]|uniref:hypothetical protein n=1 Tax=Lysinibacillus sp. NPDC093197 TaxID=3364132 RepID=UPI003820399A
MAFFIVMIFLAICIGIVTTLKKTDRNNVNASSSSSYSGNNATDFNTTGSVFSLTNTDNNNCSDTTSSSSDSSGSSCD